MNIDTNIIQIISAEQAWHYSIFPAKCSTTSIEFYSDTSEEIEAELEILFGKKILILKCNSEEFRENLIKYYPKSKNKKTSNLNLNNSYDNFLPLIIEEAQNIGSSDIHLEVYEEVCRIRLRIDGKLVERYKIDKNKYPAIINKIKISANLDIAEKRLPQDGRIFFKTDKEKFDIRVSILPTLYGEKVVMRLLSRSNTNIDLNQLGFSNLQIEEYHKAISKPHGIILISGPTGSGKTTTLYATLKELNKTTSNILTVEDPVEYTLEGINQVQLKESIGLTFAQALRTFLRQDPDIIMLGEIRDTETAQMAIRASLTGHLVFSTIHTNSAWDTIHRLKDMGIPSYLLASTLNLSMAQRLIRLLCPKCKQKLAYTADTLPNIKLNIKDYYQPQGCEHCYFTGYSGRKAIYELISIDQHLSELIKTDNSVFDNKAYKKVLLKDAALKLFQEGVTSLDEIYSYLL